MTASPTRTLWLTRACAVWLVGLGVYFIFLRPALLPEDPRFMGSTPEQIAASVPGLQAWLKHVFTVMGGFMTAAGLLVWGVAPYVSERRGATIAFAAAGAAGVGLMSAVNFSLDSDFRWVLVAPVVLWGLALACALHRQEAPR